MIMRHFPQKVKTQSRFFLWKNEILEKMEILFKKSEKCA